MKEIDFSGFVIYNVFKNDNRVVSHVIKSNTIDDYRNAIKVVYSDWAKKNDNIEDIIVTTFPNATQNVIFQAKHIGTDSEYLRDEFQHEYYSV